MARQLAAWHGARGRQQGSLRPAPDSIPTVDTLLSDRRLASRRMVVPARDAQNQPHVPPIGPVAAHTRSFTMTNTARIFTCTAATATLLVLSACGTQPSQPVYQGGATQGSYPANTSSNTSVAPSCPK
jgi:hypothetical protein